jgi:HD-GYP domain-containing protein (c-di-GMP phosphodiesterase class II)
MPIESVAVPRLSLSSSELTDLAAGVLTRQFGVPFLFYHATSPPSLSTADSLPCAPQAFDTLAPIAQQSLLKSAVLVASISDRLQALAIPLRGANRQDVVAIGIFASMPLGEYTGNDGLQPLGEATVETKLRYCQPELLQQLGAGALSAILERRQLAVREAELKQLASQLTRNYEEITLLHQLTREAQISQGAESLQHLTISLLAEMMPHRQVAYVPCHESEAVLSQGETLLKPQQCLQLIRTLGSHACRNVLVDNRLGERRLSVGFGTLAHLISVPVVEGKEQFGWLIALGRAEDGELGSVEASLMGAVAAILATHQTNVKLYVNIKELFLGIVRALTSAIDAKDPYTCGHSERVAHLAHQIARKMGLPEEEQNKIYLSGLLHDVGKIGIRDSVLLKTGRLTNEELAHIQQHPTIGFDILSAVRQLQPVLSGVRSHHENIDGTGYPDQLSGDSISLMARIVAVADSFDAMGSDRPYRPALASSAIMENFRAGSGKQWDVSAVRALLAILHETDPTNFPATAPDSAAHTESTAEPSSPHMGDSMDFSWFSPASFERV